MSVKPHTSMKKTCRAMVPVSVLDACYMHLRSAAPGASMAPFTSVPTCTRGLPMLTVTPLCLLARLSRLRAKSGLPISCS